MSKVFVDVGMSLDGFMAGANRGPRNPLGDRGRSIHRWLLETPTFRDMLGLAGGEPSPDDELVKCIFAREGAYVMGRRMFDEGEVSWPENPPFRGPVFVLTHAAREPWERQGGTTFHFVTDGLESALRQAKAAAGEKDVRISGGAQAIGQCLHAGLVDEVTVHIAPLLLGAGLRLFDSPQLSGVMLRQEGSSASSLATHINFKVVR